MILDFIRERKDILVPILLMLISLGFLGYNALNESGKQINPFSRVVVTVISYPQRVVSRVVGGFLDVWSSYSDLRNAQKENVVLKRRLDEFRMHTQELVEENALLKADLPSLPWPGAKFVNARIIGLAPQDEYRIVTINRGTTSGIRYGMPVLTGAGVVGKITGEGRSRIVPPVSASVLLLTDPRCRVDALVYRYQPATGISNAEEAPPATPPCPWDPMNWQQTRARGVAQGDYNKVILNFVPRNLDIKPGDRVVSSGLGGVFPKGLLLGTVTLVVPPAVGLSPYVEVTPAVTFDRLEEIMVMIKKGDDMP